MRSRPVRRPDTRRSLTPFNFTAFPFKFAILTLTLTRLDRTAPNLHFQASLHTRASLVGKGTFRTLAGGVTNYRAV